MLAVKWAAWEMQQFEMQLVRTAKAKTEPVWTGKSALTFSESSGVSVEWKRSFQNLEFCLRKIWERERLANRRRVSVWFTGINFMLKFIKRGINRVRTRGIKAGRCLEAGRPSSCECSRPRSTRPVTIAGADVKCWRSIINNELLSFAWPPIRWQLAERDLAGQYGVPQKGRSVVVVCGLLGFAFLDNRMQTTNW